MSINVVIVLPIKCAIFNHDRYTGFKVEGMSKRDSPINERKAKKLAIIIFWFQNPTLARHPKKRNAIVPNLRISLISVEDEFIAPFP